MGPRTGLAGGPERPAVRSGVGRASRLATLPTIVGLVGVAMSVALVTVVQRVHDDNEMRLLEQRTLEAAAVLMAAVPGIQSPLVAAAEFAEAAEGSVVPPFRRLMTPIVERGSPFVAVSMWQLDAAVPVLLEHRDPRFLVYAEGVVSGREPQPPTEGSAFDGLHHAIYLGADPVGDRVLSTDSAELPLGRPSASEVIDFGDSSLLLVMSRRGELGGGFFAWLPWLVGAVTLAATVAAVIMTTRLAGRRRAAERLAAENAALYDRQRSVAQALQRAIQPGQLPAVDGIELAARYIAGVEDVDVGGDFYDVYVADQRVVTIVGDVSSRGVEAAAVMAKARHGFRALASRGESPSTILGGLAQLIDLDDDGHFATVICDRRL